MAKNSKPENSTVTETQPVSAETPGQTGGDENKEVTQAQTAPAEKPQKPTEGAFFKKANELLKAFGRDIIFRCPKIGQWFTNEGYANDYARQKNIKLEVYKK